MDYDFYDYFEEDEEQSETIEERELELDEAVWNLLEVFSSGTGEFEDEFSEISEFLKDMICEQLFIKFSISVYRPMYLTDDAGNMDYEEFPYEEMAF